MQGSDNQEAAQHPGQSRRDANLSKRGYELLGTAQAETPDAAISNLTRSAIVTPQA